MTTKITTDNIASTTLDVISGVKVSAIVYPGNDTAADTAGNQTITLNGAGFKATPTVIVNGVSASVVTFVSSTQITFTAPANNAGTYVIYVVNPDGGTAIVVPGISYSGVPTWSTAAGSLGSAYETQSINNTVTATGDIPITYSLQSGTLPPGSSLNSANGLLSGTSAVTENTTNYTFTIRATDAQNQDTDRQFTLTINPDVVTWSSPANNATITANTDIAMSNVSLSATSAAGYNITYTANTLPTGLSLSGSNITGTPTVVANTTTLLTATAATTNRTATRTINWVVQLGLDTYWNYTTTLLNAEISTPNVWIDDASTNKFAITVNGDTRPTAFSPYETVWSNLFDGSDALSIADSAEFVLGNNFTIECWVYFTSVSGIQQFLCQRTSFANAWQFLYNWPTSGNLTFKYEDAAVIINRAWGPVVNRWYHISVCRDSSTWYLFVDGAQLGATATNSTAFPNIAAPLVIGRLDTPASEYFSGYMSNLRIVKSSLYISNFTPSTTPLTNIANTVLLTCQSNRLVDNSNNNFSITKEGDTTVSNFGPFVETDITTGSGYFDGTGDYLNAGSKSAYSFGTGDFTIEMWAYFTSVANFPTLTDSRANASSTAGFNLGLSTAKVQLYTTSQLLIGATSLSANVWYHIAVCRSGTTLRIFLNGVQDASITNSTNWSDTTLLIGATPDFVNIMTGYISNVRLLKGTALYTSAFTPPTSPLTAITNTSLLTLQSRTGENNNRFVDTSGMNNIITRFGNSTQGTFSPYSIAGWSNYFDGNGDYLDPTNNVALYIGNSDGTIEFWANPIGTGFIWSINDSDGSGSWWLQESISYDAGNKLFTISTNITNGSSTAYALSSTNNSAPLNTWTHFAFTKVGTTWNIYINGVLNATGSRSHLTTTVDGSTARIGARGFLGYPEYYTGYISNFRIVKGSAVYTSNFTPSTSSLTVVAGTRLLTCQSNRFVDNSANNFTITRTGNVSVHNFSPFGSALVTPTSYSGYFDGTGDFLDTGVQSGLYLNGVDYTIECWAYFTRSPGVANGGTIQAIMAQGDGAWSGGANEHNWTFLIDPTNLYFGKQPTLYTLAYSPSINQWIHYAIVGNSSGSITVYINGVSQGTQTGRTALGSASWSTRIGLGHYGDSKVPNYFQGFLSNIRIVKGTALYASNFTPSTSPLTAITNTSLLTCQSSTFIDNSTNNFTITVNGDSSPRSFNPFGNTVTSDVDYSVTTVGGSMYFDGTGDYLALPASSAFLFPNDFTIDFWVYLNTSLNTSPSYFLMTLSGPLYFAVNMQAGSYIAAFLNTSGTAINATDIPPTQNAWNHIALVRSGSTVRIYLNGKSSSTTATNSSTLGSSSVEFSIANGNCPSCYISNFRIVKGRAIYTSNFAPPIAPVTAIAGTTLLVNGTNGGIIDYTGKNNLETVGGVSTSTVVTKYGSRSLYFDGTDDYLLIPPTPNLEFGSSDFTIEFWWYPTSTSRQALYHGSFGTDWSIGIDYSSVSTNQKIGIWASSNGTSWNLINSDNGGNGIGTTTVTQNAWNHIAYVRNGTTWMLFVNGNRDLNLTGISGSIVNRSTSAKAIGVWFNTTALSEVSGYIDDFRITRGVARYTANFTPPQGALVAK